MLMYTSLRADVFLIIDETLQRFELTYVDGWNPSAVSRRDQLFITLMKLKLNSLLLDLAECFCVSKTAIHNIIVSTIFALHKVFVEGMMANKIPSLLKCKYSMPVCFGDFSCCRLVIDATEITQDVPSQDMTVQHKHTVHTRVGIL